jgi:enoyl-CoA hydratase/carnithine racemase
MPEPVDLDITSGVAVVTLDSPPLNIFDLAMRDGLIEALLAVRDLAGIGAMILRAGGDHFSAGADLSEFGSATTIHEARRIRWDRDPWSLLWDMPIPTIAAMHGVAVGSGLEMSLLCDIRVAGPTTKLGLPETKLGMLPAAGGTQSLTKTIGPHGSVPVVALADTMSDREAFSLGIVSELSEDPDARALALAQRLAAYDRTVVAAIKRSLRAAVDLDLSAGLALESRLSLAVRHRADGPA